MRLKQLGDRRITDQLVALSKTPDCRVLNHNGYFLNGFKFRTKNAEKNLKTQNSGVVVKGDELTGHIDYYGVIQKIIEVRYLDSNFVILFKCDWFEAPLQGRNQGRGYKKDEYGFISVDITRLYYNNDPFILGSQAELVYYVKHNDRENWHVVVKVKPRNIFDLPYDEDDLEPYQLNEFSDTRVESEASLVDKGDILNRDDVNGICLSGHTISQEEEPNEYSDDASDFDTDDYQDESSMDEKDYLENVDSDSE